MDATINTRRLRRLTRPARYRLLALAMVAGSAGLAGCEDDPVDPDGHGNHVEGFAMYAGGVQIYNYQRDLNGDEPDTLNLVAGQSYNVSIQWLDHDGHATDIEDDLELEVTVDDAAVATWTTTGVASGTLAAAGVGAIAETTLSVVLMHGGHEDYGPIHVPVRVSP